MRSKTVLLVEFSPSGGLYQYAVGLGSAIAARGQQVELWTGPRPEIASSQPGFKVRSVLPTWHPADARVRSRWFRLARRALRAAQLIFAWIVLAMRLVAAQPYAVLWSQWRFAFEPMFVVVLSRLLPSTIIGIIAHEPVPRSDAKDTSTQKKGEIIDRAFAAAWQRLDVAFTLGTKTRDLAISHWHPRCAVHVIPHGDESVLRDGVGVRSVLETGPVVLFFGVWSRYKGIDVLLDAFSRVRAELPDARLVLAGAAGADIDVDAICDQCRRIGNVDVHLGYVPVEHVPMLLDTARVVVTPYIRATQSGVAHLAYTFGRPVIATDIGDMPEVVQDEVTGLLVPPGDADGLAVAMLKVLADPFLAAELGAAGERKVAGAWGIAAERVCTALTRAKSSK